MNLSIDATSKTGSFRLAQVSCFQSVLWTVEYPQIHVIGSKWFGGSLPT